MYLALIIVVVRNIGGKHECDKILSYSYSVSFFQSIIGAIYAG